MTFVPTVTSQIIALLYIQGILDVICSLIPFQTGDSPDSPTLFVMFHHTDADATLPCVFHNITTTDLLFIKWWCWLGACLNHPLQMSCNQMKQLSYSHSTTTLTFLIKASYSSFTKPLPLIQIPIPEHLSSNLTIMLLFLGVKMKWGMD